MRFKRILVTVSICCFIIPSFVVSASTFNASAPASSAEHQGRYSAKDEVVYATLTASGAQEDMYVVNSFAVEKPGTIVDYGPYTELKNLTNLQPIEQDGEQVTFTADEEPFYYQGQLENQPLPWKFRLTYKLNGESVSPEEILGQNGQVEISIEARQNKSVDPIFFENYLLQISVPLHSETFKQIEAEDGTIANAGQNKQVTFTVMPEQEKTFVVKADVTAFEMESIEITAMPATMSIEEPETDEMKEDMHSLSDATAELHEGVSEFNKGIAALSDGMQNLQNGSAEYLQGIQALDRGSADLIAGSQSIDDALQAISQSLNGNSQQIGIDQMQELPEGLTQMALGLGEVEEGLSALKDGYVAAFNALEQSIQAIPDRPITKTEIADLKKSNADPDVVDRLLQTYEAAQTVKGTYQQTQQVFQSVEPTLDDVTSSLGEMRAHLKTMANELGSRLDSMEIQNAMKQLQEGLTELATNYQSFHSGLVEYTNGVAELSQAYGELHGGISDLNEGMHELASGADELEDGTGELADSTANLPDEMQEEIDRMINEYDKSDFVPISFVSPKNEDVATVQFVIKTESIEPEEEDEQRSTPTENEKNFWERLVDLFQSSFHWR